MGRLSFRNCSRLVRMRRWLQSEGPNGGFSDTQLDENVFNIMFRGNGYTSSYTTASETATQVNIYGNSAYATSQTTPGQTYTVKRPDVEMTIICFKEKPQTGTTVFSAKFLAHPLH